MTEHQYHDLGRPDPWRDLPKLVRRQTPRQATAMFVALGVAAIGAAAMLWRPRRAGAVALSLSEALLGEAA